MGQELSMVLVRTRLLTVTSSKKIILKFWRLTGVTSPTGGPVGHVTATPEERLAWSCGGWGHPDHSDSEESFLPQSGRCGTRDPVEGVLGVPGGGPGCHFPPLSEVSFPGFTAPLCSPPCSLPCTALIQHNVSGCWGQGQRVAFQEAPS